MNFLISDEILAKWVEDKRQALETNTGRTDFTSFACQVIADRLRSKPEQYIQYGVYWWSLKAVLAQNGYFFGDEQDQMIQEIYHHDDNDFVIVAAEDFKDKYRNTWFKGTRDFELQPDHQYHLLDTDMECLTAIS